MGFIKWRPIETELEGTISEKKERTCFGRFFSSDEGLRLFT